MLSGRALRLVEYILNRSIEGFSTLKVDEAIKDLELSKRELLEAIIELLRSGQIEILKSPDDREIIEILTNHIVEEDLKLLKGELSYEDYTSSVSPYLKFNYEDELFKTYLPRENIHELIASLTEATAKISKLNSIRETISSVAYEKLLSEYMKGLDIALLKAKRYLLGVELAINRIDAQIKDLNSDIETLRVKKELKEIADKEYDEKVKEIIKEINQIEDLKKNIILKLLDPRLIVEEAEVSPESRKKLEEINMEIEIVKARILIEGTTSELENRRRELENRREEIMKSCRRKRRVNEEELKLYIESLKEKVELIKSLSVSSELKSKFESLILKYLEMLNNCLVDVSK
jgi:hypothetical protein